MGTRIGNIFLMDFTLKIYRELLEALQGSGYTLQTFQQFLRHPVLPKQVCFATTWTGGRAMP